MLTGFENLVVIFPQKINLVFITPVRKNDTVTAFQHILEYCIALYMKYICERDRLEMLGFYDSSQSMMEGNWERFSSLLTSQWNKSESETLSVPLRTDLSLQ